MTDPTTLSLTDLGAAYRRGDLLPSEVTDYYLDKLAAGNIYRVLTPERARQQAKAADARLARGMSLGPLHGIPIALKDLLASAGEVNAAGSKVLAEGPKVQEDAPAVARLDAAGAVFLGRTNMTELAFSGIGMNPHFGTPGSALDSSRIPGGSSSGSGVAVATGLACAAIGSDTGGSVRIPASFNGIVGLKTTNGVIPTDGCVALSTTLDTLGPITRTVEDAWAMWLALSARAFSPFEPSLPDKLELLVPTNIILDEADNAVLEAFEAACTRFEAAGHKLERKDLPELQSIRDLNARYGSFASHESLALYEDMLEARGADVDPRVAKRILEFRGRPSTDYLRLVYAQQDLVRAFWQRYRRYDAILAPTVPILPPFINSLGADEAYYKANGLCLRNTSLFNFLRGPAVSVPCATTQDGLSVGLMIATAPNTEKLALAIAAWVEQEDWGTV